MAGSLKTRTVHECGVHAGSAGKCTSVEHKFGTSETSGERVLRTRALPALPACTPHACSVRVFLYDLVEPSYINT